MTIRCDQTSRRRFVKSAVAAASTMILPSWACGQGRRVAPSERITIGIVGLGSRGFNLLDTFLKQADAQILAICDVDDLHYRDKDWGDGTSFGRQPAKKKVLQHYQKKSRPASSASLAVYSDYRELCAREDIDVVVVATPDHWHALVTLEALRAGKDVYCEKPVTHTFAEGQLVYREVAQRQAVFQVGSQQRSGKNFRRAAELVRNGQIGKLVSVEVGLPDGYAAPMGDPAIIDPPEQLDYNFWTGPAPLMAYMRARHHRWWRGHLAYGGGVLMDFIGHHNDIAHWGMGMDRGGPQRVEAVGWTFPDTDVYDSPHHYEIRCEYPGEVSTSISNRNRGGTKFIGDEGWICVNRGVMEASDDRLGLTNLKGVVAESTPLHVQNFLSCVKSREECVAPAETAHRSITPGHLGYVSQAVGRALQWDAAAERVIDDDEADRLLRTVVYRKPWNFA